MVNAHEIFILLVSTGVLVLATILLKRLAKVPFWKILMTAFVLFYISTVLTVVEGFFLPEYMNFLEHLSRALFPGALLLWCLAVFRSGTLGGGRF